MRAIPNEMTTTYQKRIARANTLLKSRVKPVGMGCTSSSNKGEVLTYNYLVRFIANNNNDKEETTNAKF